MSKMSETDAVATDLSIHNDVLDQSFKILDGSLLDISSIETVQPDSYNVNDGTPLDVSREETVESETNQYSCAICNKSYKCKSSLKRHLKLHSPEETFRCSLCSTFHHDRHRLAEHIENKHPSALCLYCGKSYFSKYSLERHLATHGVGSPWKRHKCSHPGCNKLFHNKNECTDHEHTHTNLKPYLCANCQRKFNNRDHKRQHERVCTGKTENKCTVCEATFTRAASLRDHVQAQHVEEKFYCSCGKSYKYKRTIIKHQKKCKGRGK